MEALPDQPVQVGGLDVLVLKGGERVAPLVVGEEEEDVRSLAVLATERAHRNNDGDEEQKTNTRWPR